MRLELAASRYSGDYCGCTDIDGGASYGSAPQALFGSGPIVSTNVAPFAMSAWLSIPTRS